MILLKKITLTDFLSHKKTEIEFGEQDQVLLDGSSGAGKSSIFDGIIWALYGQGRVDNRSLVRRGAKKAVVRLELIQIHPEIAPPYDKQTIVVERTVYLKGKHELSVSTLNLEKGVLVAHPLTGLRELQAWIDKDLIGASYLLFINSVAYVQGNLESFVGQTAPRRKELLLEIVKAEDYSAYYEKARAMLSDLAADEQKANGRVLELEAQLGALKGRIGLKDVHLSTLKTEGDKLKDIVPKREALEAQKASLSALHKTIDVLNDVLRTAMSDRATAETVLASKMFKIADKPRLQSTLASVPSYVTSIEEATVELHGLRGTLVVVSEQEAKRNEHYAKKPVVHDDTQELTTYTRKIEKILLEPVCPSGIECPYSGDHTKQVEDLRVMIRFLVDRGEKEVVALANWATEESKLPPASDIRETIKKIAGIEAHLRNLESELAQIKLAQKDIDAITVLEAEMPGLQRALAEKEVQIRVAKTKKDEAEKAARIDEINTVNNDFESIRRQERETQDIITRLTAGLESIDMDEKACSNIEMRVADIRKVEIAGIQEKARKVGLIKDAFGSKGIETLVIDYLLPKLEERINAVLAKLSDFRVRLDTQRKSADGEGIVEGLFITIINDVNEELPFESYSGGEKLKISVSISEALATLQKVGFRLFDETFLGLDDNSTESFSDVLIGLQKEFGQVFCISHLLQIKTLFDKQIKIVKTNGISYV